MQRISKLIRWANLVVIIFTFTSYLSPYINPEHFWPITFLGMAYPLLLLINLFFVFWWLIRKNRYFLFSFFCILLGWNHLVAFVGWNSSEASSSKEEIHVLSYNIRGGKELNAKIQKHNLQDDDLAKLIFADVKNTILCFQEAINFQSSLLEDEGFLYLHKLPYIGTSIYAQTPFLDKGGKRFGDTANSYLWADIAINKQRIRIFNIHLQSNSISGVTNKVIKKGDLQEKETWRNIGTVINRIRNATRSRSRQAEMMAEEIAKSPYPVVVCGDFNDTPQSYSYQVVGNGLKDTFKEKGNGFGTTYAGLIPALRIDYIFVDPRFKVLENTIPRVSFSDHYPVISRMELLEN